MLSALEDDMINILYALNGTFHKGGTEAVVLSYYNNIDRSKYHIDFLLHGHEEDCKSNEIHNYLLSCGSKIFYVTPRGENFIKNKHEIKNVLRENKYDIVHSHMDAAGYFLLKEAKKAGIPVCISHSHNTANKRKNDSNIKDLIYKIIHGYAITKLPKVTDARIACSTEAGNWLFNDSTFTVLNNAIDINKYAYNHSKREKVRQELGFKDEMVIGHVGRFAVQKNHEFLIDIFSGLLNRHADAKLVLIGTGELLNSIKQKVSSLGIEKNVLFLGVRNDVDDLMQGFDVFLLPSLHEGLPVVGIEAQASGLPCVISSTVSSEVKLSDNTRFVSLDAPVSEWCNSIEDVYNRGVNRKQGVDIVKNAGFDIKNVIVNLMKIYDDNLKEKGIAI